MSAAQRKRKREAAIAHAKAVDALAEWQAAVLTRARDAEYERLVLAVAEAKAAVDAERRKL